MKNNLEKSFLTNIRTLKNYKDSTFLISYSAGIDSTAVLFIANKIFKKLNLKFEAVFFSHKNSPINDGEEDSAELARKVCEKLNIKFHHEQLDLSKRGNYSWEQYGRMLRHDFFDKNQCDYVLLGHHQNDQDETTLIQLFRGAGNGVKGMKFQDRKLVRPFLDFPKSALTEYLVENNIPWLDDPTNVNEDMTRNFWRNSAIPCLKEHYPNLESTLKVIREKVTESDSLAYELAKVDGLDSFVKDLTTTTSINQVRLTNLVVMALSSFNMSCQKKTLKKVISDNWLKNDFEFKSTKYDVEFSKEGKVRMKFK